MSTLSCSSSSSSYSFARCGSTNAPRSAPPTRISFGSIPTRPKRKKTNDDDSETRELVRLLTRKISDKEPLERTLNKYVRLVRTEHCFLLFEELGKHDKWLPCLEVSELSIICNFPNFVNFIEFLMF